ncbi:hypothetical protein LXL04_036510 [Taraxacum kok-saghyz]
MLFSQGRNHRFLGRNWNRGASCWGFRSRCRTFAAQKDGRDDADAGGRKLHESPAIIALPQEQWKELIKSPPDPLSASPNRSWLIVTEASTMAVKVDSWTMPKLIQNMVTVLNKAVEGCG